MNIDIPTLVYLKHVNMARNFIHEISLSGNMYLILSFYFTFKIIIFRNQFFQKIYEMRIYIL